MVRRSPLRPLTQELSRLYSPLVCFCVLGVVSFSMVLPAFVVAQIATTITPDSSLPSNTVVSQIGGVYHIDAGTIRGRNQFHSFSQFDLGTGKIASFNGPATIVNILSRVTGGAPSGIDGTLRSSIEGANLFFLNPAGVVFGHNASLDISGSFYVSSADYIQLGKGSGAGRFSASSSANDVLIAAPPTAFGFLGQSLPIMPNLTTTNKTTTTGITIKGLDTKGTPLIVVGKDADVKEKTMPGIEIREGIIRSDGGSVNLVSVAAPGIVPLNISKFKGNFFSTLGEITLSNYGRIDVSGVPHGIIVIRGGKLTMKNASLFAVHEGGEVESATALDFHLTEQVNLTNSSIVAEVNESATGTGNGGNINIETETFAMEGGHIEYSTLTLGDIDAGNMSIKANEVKFKDGTRLIADTKGIGNGGSLLIEADALHIQNGVDFSVATEGNGNAGQINLKVNTLWANVNSKNNPVLGSKRVSLQSIAGRNDLGNDGLIGKDELLETAAAGKAGNLLIQKRSPSDESEMLLHNVQVDTIGGNGGGGDVTILTDNLMLSKTRINADTAGRGPAGSLQLNVDTLSADQSFLSARSTGGDTVNVIQGKNAKRIDVFAIGNAGSINIDGLKSPAKSVTLTDTILTTSVGAGGGTGGDITITTENLVLDTLNPETGVILADSFGSGNAGNISLNVDSLTGTDALVGSRAGGVGPGSGNAGNITIQGQAGQGSHASRITFLRSRVTTEIMSPDLFTADLLQRSVLSEFKGDGEGGEIKVLANDFIALDATNLIATVHNQSHVADTAVAGITVTAPAIKIGFGGVRASTTGSRNAGNINVNASRMAIVDPTPFVGTAQVEASTSSTGNAGNIVFNVENLVGDNAVFRSRSRSFEPNSGNAGNITIQGPRGEGSKARIIRTARTLFSTEVGPLNDIDLPDFHGDGEGGQIKLLASDSIILQQTPRFRTIFQVRVHDRRGAEDTAMAGIELSAPNFNLMTGRILARTTGSRDAGSIVITATDTATLTGPPGRSPLILASTFSTGNAGNIVFNVGELDATNTLIRSRSTNPSPGSGNAGQVSIAGPGSNGDVLVPVPRIVTLTDTEVSTSVAPNLVDSELVKFQGDGKGGTIQILGGDDIVFRNSIVSTNVNDTSSSIAPTVSSVAVMGEGNLVLQAGTTLTAESLGTAPAGNLRLKAGDTLRVSDSTLTTSALQAKGDNQGGDMTLNAQSMIHIVDSTLKSNVAGGPNTRGGNIKLDPQFVAVHNSTIQSTATAGTGGTITITADKAVLLDTRTVLDVGSQFGGSGTVNVQSPIQNLSGTIVPLPDEVLKVSLLYGEHCFAHKAGNYSSFTRRSRPVSREPGGFLLSPLLEHANAIVWATHDRHSRPLLAVKRLGISRIAPTLIFVNEEQTLTMLENGCMF